MELPTLSEHDRALATGWFPVGGTWAAYRDDDEALRWWQIVRDESSVVLLRHGTNTFYELGLVGGRITTARFLEGPAAIGAARVWAFRPNDAQRALVARTFVVGRTLGELPQMFAGLGGAPAGHRRFDVQRSGVVDLELVGDTIRTVRWLTGGDALDALDADADARRWDVPDARPPLDVRTREEARLFVAVMSGDLVAEREADGTFHVLARTPDGPRRYTFVVGDPSATVLLDFGVGTSTCLDPASFVLFASQVEKGLPTPGKAVLSQRAVHARKLALAAAGLREAVKFILPGDDLPPLGGYRTRAGEFLRETAPARFRRRHLLDEAARLDDLAAEYQR